MKIVRPIIRCISSVQKGNSNIPGFDRDRDCRTKVGNEQPKSPQHVPLESRIMIVKLDLPNIQNDEKRPSYWAGWMSMLTTAIFCHNGARTSGPKKREQKEHSNPTLIIPNNPCTPHDHTITNEVLRPSHNIDRYIHPLQLGIEAIWSDRGTNIWPLNEERERRDDKVGGRYSEHGYGDREEDDPCVRLSQALRAD